MLPQKDFTLLQILQLDMELHKQDIEQILINANFENKYYSQYIKIKEYWQYVEFQFEAKQPRFQI